MTIGVYQKLSGSMWLNLDNVEAYYAGPVDTAIKDVESKIEAIGTEITLESEGAIEEARTAYDALNEAQKMQVSNYETLEKAEEKLAELKKAPVHADGLSDSCDADGNWYYYSDNAVDTAYTGLAANQNGWFMVVNGKVDFGYTGLAANENGWFMVVSGAIDLVTRDLQQMKMAGSW